MKSFNQLFILLTLTLIGFSACNKDEEPTKEPGNIAVLFDNKVDGNNLKMQDAGSKTYDFTDANGQAFNISSFGYYISEVELSGSDITHADPLNVSADASEVRGYYHVKEDEASSRVINLTGIAPGTYDKIKFTIGINESGVQQGAAGGVLDPANGAWFWNWNAGYIGLAIEGSAANSGQEYVDWGNGFETLEGTFAVHVGGWKDVEPAPGEDPKFVNNIRVVELDFDSPLMIEEGLSPEAHLNVDLMKILDGIDFSTTFAVHRPDLGRPFADKINEAFTLDHVHQ